MSTNRFYYALQHCTEKHHSNKVPWYTIKKIKTAELQNPKASAK